MIKGSKNNPVKQRRNQWLSGCFWLIVLLWICSVIITLILVANEGCAKFSCLEGAGIWSLFVFFPASLLTPTVGWIIVVELLRLSLRKKRETPLDKTYLIYLIGAIILIAGLLIDIYYILFILF